MRVLDPKRGNAARCAERPSSCPIMHRRDLGAMETRSRLCYRAVMDKEGFDMLFNERVAGRLARLGFVSKGKTLYFETKHFTIALVRLGGRMSSPGTISHILCFRHSFLRIGPNRFQTSFPHKFSIIPISSLLEDADKELVYRPQNLNYDYERFHWESADERSVCQKLDRIAAHIENRFLPWAKTLTPATARSEITQFGEKAWCEQMRIADYAARSAAE